MPRWMPIRGTDYLASDTGLIKNARTRRILKPIKLTNGYRKVCIPFGKHNVRQCYIHRLVAHTFLGMPLNSKMCIDHKNHIRHDNNLINLRVVTQTLNNNNRFSPKNLTLIKKVIRCNQEGMSAKDIFTKLALEIQKAG